MNIQESIRKLRGFTPEELRASIEDYLWGAYDEGYKTAIGEAIEDLKGMQKSREEEYKAAMDEAIEDLKGMQRTLEEGYKAAMDEAIEDLKGMQRTLEDRIPK